MTIAQLRKEYHAEIFRTVLRVDKSGVPNNADRGSEISKSLACGIIDRIALSPNDLAQVVQQTGKAFEMATSDFVEKCFSCLAHLRPGKWRFNVGGGIERFEQYSHLADISKVLEQHAELRAALGDYLVRPDIIISRTPLTDGEINRRGKLVTASDAAAARTPLRQRNSEGEILHASVSCKWTLRSDRSQNARTEGLNLIRNRKGKTPHIVIVTGEPTPHRIASIALGTGDMDCVYHFALDELKEAVAAHKSEGAKEMLDILIVGKRLRDISDLPFDLAI